MRRLHTSAHHLVNAFAVNGEETGVTAAGKCQLSAVGLEHRKSGSKI